jgi:hypothetical protein
LTVKKTKRKTGRKINVDQFNFRSKAKKQKTKNTFHHNTYLNRISPNTWRATITKPINAACCPDLNNLTVITKTKQKQGGR